VNWREFVAQIIESIAWPVAVIILVLLFRHRIGELLHDLRGRMRDLREISGPAGIGAKFAAGVDEVKEDIEEGLAASPSSPAIDGSSPPGEEPSQHVDRWDYERMRKLAVVSPRGAVLEAFLVLEETLFEAARSRGLDLRADRRSARHALRVLQLPPRLENPIQRLIELRNDAVHVQDFQLTPEAVIDYIGAVQDVVANLRALEPPAKALWEQL
jgi:hypothetical protein